MIQKYFVFGMNVHSEFNLPVLLPGADDSKPDVNIQVGQTPDTLPNCQKKGVAFEIAPNEFLLDLKDIARFHVVDGTSITIERKSEDKDEDIQLFLLGSCLGAILHQRKILALHASAIVHEGEAVLFTGISGVGKSTTANGFRLDGYKMLTDDVCPVQIIDGIPYALPGYPQSKLWEDSLEKLEIEYKDLNHIRDGVNKRKVPIRESFITEPTPIKKVYVLRSSNMDDVEIINLEDADKFRIILSMTYRRYLLKDMGIQPYHFANGTALANAIPIKVVRRPQAFCLPELMELVKEDLGEKQLMEEPENKEV